MNKKKYKQKCMSETLFASLYEISRNSNNGNHVSNSNFSVIDFDKIKNSFFHGYAQNDVYWLSSVDGVHIDEKSCLFFFEFKDTNVINQAIKAKFYDSLVILCLDYNKKLNQSLSINDIVDSFDKIEYNIISTRLTQGELSRYRVVSRYLAQAYKKDISFVLSIPERLDERFAV